ncbi:DNA topoisomerase IB [Phenylobacterium sp.]|uniref:DNA topoisomerase IB n=1 Tax=Phenylobacterium sp. TaxID=1871053 RepID=UPI0035645912
MARDLPDLPIPAEEMKAAGLTYVSDLDAGIRRRKAFHGFNYVDADGKPVTGEPTLDRIRKLAIPPAWTEVWIAPTERGHIQATGRDVKGRKQYRYHERWREARDGGKYDRLIAFGRALPKLRTRVDRDLARRGLPREKVLAAVVRVMEITLVRVGNEEYAKTNKSFGLTTLRDRHAKVGAEKAVFEFRGKSGKMHTTGFSDRRLARIVKACQDLPGQRLFQYLDEDGQRHTVESADVNAYLREVLGDDFSAKDFRTWAGTLAAARALVTLPECAGEGGAKKNVATCVKAVAGVLGNTPAVCRKAYIHPVVLEAYEAGALPLKPTANDRAFELAVLKFLEAARDKPAKARKKTAA